MGWVIYSCYRHSRTLFLSVLLCFLALLAANSAALMLAERLAQPSSDDSIYGDAFQQQVESLGRVAMELRAATGSLSKSWPLNDNDPRVVIRLFGADFEDESSLIGQDDELLTVIRESKQSGRAGRRIVRGRFVVAHPVVSDGQAVTVAIVDQTVESPNPMRSPLARGSIILLVSCAVCFALARKILRPVQKLSQTVRRYGGGDLDARVGAIGWPNEIGELGAQFDTMADRLQAHVSAQQKLLADVSHELRSPLARINLALAMLKNRPTESGGALERVEHEVRRLNDLIAELLTLSRLDSPSAPETTNVDLARVLEAIVNDAEFEAREKRIVVNHRLTEPVRVRANVNLLYRALDNLVRNAIKFAFPDTVVDVELVLVKHGEDLTQAAIRVRDRGPGVPQSELESVLQPFVRSSDAAPATGYGLGLSIAERIVRQVGGTIKLANADDGGLIAEVTIPAAD